MDFLEDLFDGFRNDKNRRKKGHDHGHDHNDTDHDDDDDFDFIDNKKSRTNLTRCTGCNATLENNVRFCPQCGKEVVKVSVCPQCGVKVLDNASFCHSCGKKVR